MRFRYLAEEPDGRERAGWIDAVDHAAARCMIEQQGLRLRTLTVDGDDFPVALPPDQSHELKGASGARPDSGGALSVVTSEQLVQQVAELQTARIPLAQGLRMAARGTRDRGFTRALHALADLLEQGSSPEEAFARLSPRIAPHVRGLLRAAQRSGEGPEMLLSLLDQSARQRQVQRSFWLSLSYPGLLLLVSLLGFIVIQLTIVRMYRGIYDEWQLAVSNLTRVVFWWSDTGAWILVALLAAVATACATAWLTLGSARWRFVLASAPLIGVLWYWGGAARLCRLLSVLLRHRMPLPDALELAEASMSDALYQRSAGALRSSVQQGIPLATALLESPGIPDTIVPFAAAGERSQNLATTLEEAAEMLEQRLEARAAALQKIVPPLLLVIIMFTVFFTIVALFVPLVALLRGFM